MGAIEMLKGEYHSAKGRMEDVAKAIGAKKKDLFEGLKRELTVLHKMEEQVFYPAVAGHAKSAGLGAIDKKAHEAVETALAALSNLAVTDKKWSAAFDVMRAKLMSHIAAEEAQLYKAIEKAMSTVELTALELKMKAAKAALAKSLQA